LHSNQVIYLSRQDSIDTACELLQHATPGARLWMVLPWRMRFALNLVNLKRLRRVADNAAVDLHLVSSHFQTRALARDAGIAVCFTVPHRLRSYRRVRRKGVQGLRARVVPVEGKVRFRGKGGSWTFSLGAGLLYLIGIIGLIGVLLGAIMLFWPSATVTLKPVARPISTEFSVTANPAYKEINYGEAVIPARIVQVIVEGRGDTPATARMDVAEGHASGEVVFANRTSESVTVPKGTIVRTSSGINVRFYTVSEVELPPVLYSHVRIAVIALEPGPTGNVKALTINVVEGEVADQVDVLNDAPTKGGTIQRVPLVSYKDFDTLRADLIERLQKQAYDQLVSELEEGEFVPPDSLDVQVMSQHFDQVVDQRSDVLSMDMKVVARGVAVEGQALQPLSTRFLESQGGEGVKIIADSLVVKRSEQVRVEGRVVYFDVAANGVVAPIIDVDRVKASIRGKEVAEATQWLNSHLDLEVEPHITVSPKEWERLPFLLGRLDVVISSEQS